MEHEIEQRLMNDPWFRSVAETLANLSEQYGGSLYTELRAAHMIVKQRRKAGIKPHPRLRPEKQEAEAQVVTHQYLDYR